MPTLGILGMTTHRIGKLAQIMYAEYDLNKSQSMILFQLHKSGRSPAERQYRRAPQSNILCLPHPEDQSALSSENDWRRSTAEPASQRSETARYGDECRRECVRVLRN